MSTPTDGIQLNYMKTLDTLPDTQNGGRINPAFVSSVDSLSPKEGDSSGLRHRKSVGDSDQDKDDNNVEGQGIGDGDLTGCNLYVNSMQTAVVNFYKENKVWIWRIFFIVLGILYFAYFAYAMYYRFGDEGSYRLLVCTLFGAFLILLHFTWPYISPPFDKFSDYITHSDQRTKMRIMRWSLYVACSITIIVVLITEVAMDTPENLISLGGLAAFLVICYVTSANPARVNWHPVFWGLALQFFFALIILRTRWGYETFKWLGDRVTEFLAYTDAGSTFVFMNINVHLFAFKIMPVVTFFSSFIAITYYLGVMQAIVGVIGRFLGFCMDTTPAESLNAAGNIFVGMTEAPLMIRPFLDDMTKSELHAVMTGGFATIAGSVLGAYIGFGVPANHLLSASVMSAPAALAISKLMYPETEMTKASKHDYNKMKKGQQRNIIEAMSEGASMSIKLIANIVVNVIAFLAMLAFINATLTWFGDRVGVKELTFQFICSYVLYPVAIFMGTDPQDCRRVAELVGIKTFTNEFIAYESLKELLINRQKWLNYTRIYNDSSSSWHWDGQAAVLVHWGNETLTRGFMSHRSEVISTYALCGFANVGSMGILLGGLAALAPGRKGDLSKIVLRAMIAGNIACFMTASIAGLFYRNIE